MPATMNSCLKICGRLGERVELPGVEARRNQEVARAARRVLHHERRLDLGEAVRGEDAARRLIDLRAHQEVLLQRGAAQIEVAVLEADRLARDAVVDDLERRRLGAREDRERVAPSPRCRRWRGSGSCGRRARDGAGDADAELAAQLAGRPRVRFAPVPGSNTTWVRPPRSRRSMNTQPPWSRRAATQPNRTTRLPASLARSAAAVMGSLQVGQELGHGGGLYQDRASSRARG